MSLTTTYSQTLHLCASVIHGLRKSASTCLILVRQAGTWHLYRWRHDPTYPGALLAVGKSIIVALVPRAVLAAALISVLTAMWSGHAVDPIAWNAEWPDTDY